MKSLLAVGLIFYGLCGISYGQNVVNYGYGPVVVNPQIPVVVAEVPSVIYKPVVVYQPVQVLVPAVQYVPMAIGYNIVPTTTWVPVVRRNHWFCPTYQSIYYGQ